MKKIMKLYASVLAVFLSFSASAGAEIVKSLDFTAVTRTEKVVIDINSEKQTMEYLTPARNFNYIFLDYDYSADQNSESTVIQGTVVDTMLKTASKVVIYSNGRFTDMRLGKRHVTFTDVQQFDVSQ